MSLGAAAADPPAAPPELVIEGVRKHFGGVAAVEDCSLSVAKGEILALLGPSGCGKSTLLNLIAGFESPDAGAIRLRGNLLNDVPPHRRNVAMVFQHYALFPHLTVEENIGYGLHARRLEGAAIRQRVDEMTALLKLQALGKRYPAQLSGGQRQRVAVARALAIRPQMLLLDEAFSALDRNLREEMQVELSLLLHRLDVATILVTHDQREAFALADRIAVMEAGRIAQIGPPRQVYSQPANSHVLRFLGTTNALKATVAPDGPGLRLVLAEGVSFACPPDAAATLGSSTQAIVYVRSEDIDLAVRPTAVHTAAAGVVALSTFMGAQERIVVVVGGQQVVIERPARDGGDANPIGAPVFLAFEPAKCRIAAPPATT